MKKLMKKFEDIMIAITFAEAGEYDEASGLLRDSSDVSEETGKLEGFKKVALERAGK